MDNMGMARAGEQPRRSGRGKGSCVLAAALGLSLAAGSAVAQTMAQTPTEALAQTLATTPSVIDQIKARNTLRCGSNTFAGFADLGADGRWRGFMVDICRAAAAAVLGSAERAELVPVEASVRFPALLDGSIDLLTDGATVTLGRDLGQGFTFPGIYLYDGQAFAAHSHVKGDRLADLGRPASVCVVEQTTTLANLRDHIRRTGVPLEPVVMASDEGAWTAFIKRRCDLFTSDRVGLGARLHSLLPQPDAPRLLADVISKEPLGPAVRDGDPRWEALVRWLLAGLVAAEERGITAANLATFPAAGDAEILALTGKGEDWAAVLGVEPGWLARAIAQVGNYGEIFARNLGEASPLRMPRGPNALWRDGGLMYAPPLR